MFTTSHRVLGGLALLASLSTAAAGQGQSDARPQIVVSASEEVEVAPDRAELVVAVETRGRTSQAAASENAKLANAVLDGLRRAGIAGPQIRTQGLMLSPEYQYPREGGRPTVTGYVARNSVRVDVRDISRVSAVIDAAIAQGATNVSGPSFSLSNPDSARRVALDLAVRRARGDAEAMARAAGTQLGSVLELSSSDAMERPMFEMVRSVAAMKADEAPSTPIEAGVIKVRASVTLRVALLP